MITRYSPELAALAASLLISLALASLGIAQDALSPAPHGAVQHALPKGGYVGTAALRTASAAPARGAVQHAMPAGGYVGTGPASRTRMAAACPAQDAAVCKTAAQD